MLIGIGLGVALAVLTYLLSIALPNEVNEDYLMPLISGLFDLLKLVLDIIPDNLVEPFRIDNGLQAIVIAVFIGIIMLKLGSRVQKIRGFLDEVSELVYKMMAAICKLLPFFVYLGIANLLLSGRLSQISNVAKLIVITLGGAVITIAITTIRTVIVTKSPFRRYSRRRSRLTLSREVRSCAWNLFRRSRNTLRWSGSKLPAVQTRRRHIGSGSGSTGLRSG